MSVQIRVLFIVVIMTFTFCAAAARMSDDTNLVPPTSDSLLRVRAEIELLREGDDDEVCLRLGSRSETTYPFLLAEIERAFEIITEKLGGRAPTVLRIQIAPDRPTVCIAIRDSLSMVTIPLSFLETFLVDDRDGRLERYKELLVILAHEVGHREEELNCFYRSESLLPVGLELTTTALEILLAVSFGYLVGTLSIPEQSLTAPQAITVVVALICSIAICLVAKSSLSYRLEHAADAYAVGVLADRRERHLVLESALNRFLDNVISTREGETASMVSSIDSRVSSFIKVASRLLSHPSVERRVEYIRSLNTALEG